MGISSVLIRRVGFKIEEMELRRFVRPLSVDDVEGFSSWASEKLRFRDVEPGNGLRVRCESGDEAFRADCS